MPLRVQISPAAGRDLRRLPGRVRDRLEAAILALGEEPRPNGVRKVRGTERTFRIRVGDYRVVYDVHDDARLVVILMASRRHEGTYRGL